MKKHFVILILILVFISILIPACASTSGNVEAKEGDTVQVNYTGTLKDGTVFDTSVNSEPLEFKLGSEQMIPGFEKAVLGMKEKEKKTITIPSSEAYGHYQQELVLQISKKDLSASVTPQVGMQLQSKDQDGNPIIATIIRVTEDTVFVDMNHPLAGQDLTFEIELLKIL